MKKRLSVPDECRCKSCRWCRAIFKDFKTDDWGRISRHVVVLKVDCAKHDKPISLPKEDCQHYEKKFRKGNLTILSGSQVEVKTYEIKEGDIAW